METNKIFRSSKNILGEKQVFTKKKYLFPMEFASEVDRETGKKGMIISINQTDTFIPCGEPVDLKYEVWALLKNIGRIGRICLIDEDGNIKVL